MKKIFVATTALLLSLSAFAQKGSKKVEAPRVLEFHTEVVDGKTSWVPAKVNVHRGEKLTLIFKHELKTGPDFHGVTIPALHIVEKIDRNKEKKISVEIPKDLKDKELTISCQFHPGHQPANLILEN